MGNSRKRQSSEGNTRQTCAKIPPKQSISQIFFEATNNLKRTELTSEEIRNYALKKYNLDILEHIEDINMITRFSEIKQPHEDTAPKHLQNTKRVKCEEKRVKPKRAPRKSNRRRHCRNTKKEPVRRRSRRKNKSSQKKVTTKATAKVMNRTRKCKTDKVKYRKRSRIKSPRIGKGKEKAYRTTPKTKKLKPQNSPILLKNLVSSQTSTDTPGKILARNLCPSTKKTSKEIEITKVPRMFQSNSTNHLYAITSQEKKTQAVTTNSKSPNYTDSIELSPQNETNAVDKSNLQNKIMLAGCAVKSFIEGLGSKCASRLMFFNHRFHDKSCKCIPKEHLRYTQDKVHSIHGIKCGLLESPGKSNEQCNQIDNNKISVNEKDTIKTTGVKNNEKKEIPEIKMANEKSATVQYRLCPLNNENKPEHKKILAALGGKEKQGRKISKLEKRRSRKAAVGSTSSNTSRNDVACAKVGFSNGLEKGVNEIVNKDRSVPRNSTCNNRSEKVTKLLDGKSIKEIRRLKLKQPLKKNL